MRILKEYFYKLDTLSVFDSPFTKRQGRGQATANFFQTPLFFDVECQEPVPTASLLYEFIVHIIDGTVQPYIDQMAILIENQTLQASRVTDVLFFIENVPYHFTCRESSGIFRCAKQVIVVNQGQGVRRVTIVG